MTQTNIATRRANAKSAIAVVTMAAATYVSLIVANGLSPAAAQNWTTYQAPGSPFTTHTGPHGWSGSTYQAPDSPFSSSTFHGPHGQTRTCQTYQAPGSPFSSTTCH